VIASDTGVTNWPRVVTVLGETAREVGVLMVVFAPLEATFSGVSVSTARIVAMIASGLGALVGDIILETRK
jgi:hypothetical protein